MDENNTYYRRGMHIIDKLLKTYTNDSTFYKKRIELMKDEMRRFRNNGSLMVKDVNSIYITAFVALLGLNKENIENIDKHSNYGIFKLSEEKKKIMNLDFLKKEFPLFELDRNIATPFDDWLSVENCDYPTLSYMMNVRNGMLHSEYETLDEYGDMISVNNSNYTHFKSKVFLYPAMEFCLFYFGNSAWTGLSENVNIYSTDRKQKITNKEELEEAIKGITINNIKYKLKAGEKQQQTPESKIYDLMYKNKCNNLSTEEFLYVIFGKKYDYTNTETNLTEDEIKIIIKMIEKYYGDSFYSLNRDSQFIQINSLARYLKDSRSTISEWICDYVDFYNWTMNIVFKFDKKYSDDIDKLAEDIRSEDGKRSVYACKTSLLILKLYHVLYRLQNKKYESIDYNNIDFDLNDDEYNYTRIDMDGSITTDFEIDKAKLKLKDITSSDKELSNKVVCDIIRNSLCHGNIEMNFKIENDELKEYVVFDDSYHSKTRRLEITLEKLEKLLNSEAFLTKNCIMKEEKGRKL